MKFLPLILANLSRKKLRTILTVGSFAVALFLFAFLAVVNGAFDGGVDIAGADRLVIINRISIIQPLAAFLPRPDPAHPGREVRHAQNWFGGVYQEREELSSRSFAIDPENQRQVYAGTRRSRRPMAEFRGRPRRRDRGSAGPRSVSAGKSATASRSRTQLDIGGTWEFNIRRHLSTSPPEATNTQFWFQWDYFDERRTVGQGQRRLVRVKLDNPDDAVRVAKAIDDMFRQLILTKPKRKRNRPLPLAG